MEKDEEETENWDAKHDKSGCVLPVNAQMNRTILKTLEFYR